MAKLRAHIQRLEVGGGLSGGMGTGAGAGHALGGGGSSSDVSGKELVGDEEDVMERYSVYLLY